MANMPKDAEQAIPLEALLDDPSFKRNIQIEALSSVKADGLTLALIELAADAAEAGRKFVRGRKQGTEGKTRLLIREALERNQSLTAKPLWEQFRHEPPKGYVVRETARLGAYLEAPSGQSDDMTYRRFCNVVSEERKLLKAR